ncbi:MAG: diadenylate cyclase CdaA, partial [Firmicutes bacterium]|nr:diadenylate cyclase CdaA [Bacillota bacterium]
NFGWYDVADIVVTAFVIYGVLRFLKNNYALRLVKFLVLFVIVSILLTSKLLAPHMRLVPVLFGNFVLILLVCVLVIFPQEIRKGLWKLGSPKKYQGVYCTNYQCTEQQLRTTIVEIVKAVQTISKRNTGALLVVAPTPMHSYIVDSGTRLDAVVSSSLLESIFVTKGPMHDGAVVIYGNRAVSAGCFLPLTQSVDIAKTLGARHRAAMGVTESTDSLCILCSEETGIISVAKDGKLRQYFDSRLLTDALEQVFGLKGSDQEPRLLAGGGN